MPGLRRCAVLVVRTVTRGLVEGIPYTDIILPPFCEHCFRSVYDCEMNFGTIIEIVVRLTFQIFVQATSVHTFESTGPQVPVRPDDLSAQGRPHCQVEKLS